jgi:hypothetical protein
MNGPSVSFLPDNAAAKGLCRYVGTVLLPEESTPLHRLGDADQAFKRRVPEGDTVVFMPVDFQCQGPHLGGTEAPPHHKEAVIDASAPGCCHLIIAPSPQPGLDPRPVSLAGLDTRAQRSSATLALHHNRGGHKHKGRLRRHHLVVTPPPRMTYPGIADTLTVTRLRPVRAGRPSRLETSPLPE